MKVIKLRTSKNRIINIRHDDSVGRYFQVDRELEIVLSDDETKYFLPKHGITLSKEEYADIIERRIGRELEFIIVK